MGRRRRDDPDAPQLDRGTIIRAAIDLIDREGLDDFSLRGLARHLGAANMSVYYYVTDREELLTAVLDEILAGVSLQRLPNDPADALGALSARFVGMFMRHPETIPLFVLQPVITIGPHGAAVFDRFVGLLRAMDLTDGEAAEATVVVVEYLCGHLIGHLPQLRRQSASNAEIVDEVLAALPEGAAPNIRAIAPALRRSVDVGGPAAGIGLIVAGLASIRHQRTNATVGTT